MQMYNKKQLMAQIIYSCNAILFFHNNFLFHYPSITLSELLTFSDKVTSMDMGNNWVHLYNPHKQFHKCIHDAHIYLIFLINVVEIWFWFGMGGCWKLELELKKNVKK